MIHLKNTHQVQTLGRFPENQGQYKPVVSVFNVVFDVDNFYSGDDQV